MQRIDPENLEEKLYSSREVAQILGVSLRTIYRYIESGKLLPETQTKSGRHLFAKEAIVGFLFPDTGYRVQDTGGSRKQEERGGKDKRMERGIGREIEGRELRVPARHASQLAGVAGGEGRDEVGELRIEDDKDKSRDLRVEGAEEKLEEKGSKEGIPVEKGEIKFPLEKKTEEIKLTKEGAVAPRHERDILKELRQR